MARDVAKAFDKVWHEGLKYKIIRENLPNCFEKILCNFLDDRSARIRIEEFIGPKFNLKSGVPQGSILSPTLYIFYTADMPPAGPGCLNIGFADDITQVITYPGKSRGMLARRITREIVKINNYEKQWKIQTSKPKFKLVSMAKTKTEKITIDGQELPYAPEATILGLTLTRTGINTHFKNRLRKARYQRKKLRRFRNLRTKIKVQLYKSLLRPVMEYPIVPLCILSKTNKGKIQAFQNISIKSATRNDPEYENQNTEELHQTLRIPAINVRMHQLANRVWDRFQILNENIAEASNMENTNNDRKDHSWFRRISPFVNSPEPEPKYLY